jgi:hypothetical protein
MPQEKWTTVFPKPGMVAVRVTGGKTWDVVQVENDGFSTGERVFSCAGEIRRTLKSRVADLDVWTH